MAENVHISGYLNVLPKPKHMRPLQVDVDGLRVEEVTPLADLDAPAPKIVRERLGRVGMRLEDSLG